MDTRGRCSVAYFHSFSPTNGGVNKDWALSEEMDFCSVSVDFSSYSLFMDVIFLGRRKYSTILLYIYLPFYLFFLFLYLTSITWSGHIIIILPFIFSFFIFFYFLSFFFSFCVFSSLTFLHFFSTSPFFFLYFYFCFLFTQTLQIHQQCYYEYYYY